MFDLIYCENHDNYKEIQSLIKNQFPNAVLDDGSDSIHENRFSVEMEIEQEAWFTFVIEKGFALLSFNFTVYAMKNPKEAVALALKVTSKGEKQMQLTKEDIKTIVEMNPLEQSHITRKCIDLDKLQQVIDDYKKYKHNPDAFMKDYPTVRIPTYILSFSIQLDYIQNYWEPWLFNYCFVEGMK